jgi:hypothetical protein
MFTLPIGYKRHIIFSYGNPMMFTSFCIFFWHGHLSWEKRPAFTSKPSGQIMGQAIGGIKKDAAQIPFQISVGSSC